MEERDTSVSATGLKARARGTEVRPIADSSAALGLLVELWLEQNAGMAACDRCGAVAPEDARFCPSCGASLVATGPTEERKLATVVFADLVGSTQLGEQDPERTRALLDRFYDAMADEVQRAGGTLEKFAGDAVMAVFGAPAAQEDHAERALHAALAMRKRLEELFGGGLILRIGINTGEVMVGRAREGSSFVTGDAVNVAARLEQTASPNEILVGERTVSVVRGAFEFGQPLTVEAKGKPGGVACRRLVTALTLARPRGVGGLHRVFVGRTTELTLLQATYERAAREGEPHFVTIMGDAGVGKTRLIRELWEWLAGRSPEPTRRTGRCLPYGKAITYWPLGEILKEHLGVLEDDPPDAVRRLLGAREVLGLTLGLDPGGDIHPLAVRERLHEAWVDFLQDLAAERPVVLLIEDLNWAEDPLLDLLERTMRDVQGPLVVIATARPELLERRSSWGGGQRNASTIWLEPLSPGDSGRMLGDLLGTELPDRIRTVITEHAEGNPFFVEELLSTLIDQGIVTRRDGSWAIENLPSGFRVPDSVQAVVAARIDMLAPEPKGALQAASVIGRIFWSGPVRELLEGGEPDFGLLEDRDFIRRRSGSSMSGEREFAFKHAVTREVAYESLPRARRARLHAAFADWLERLGGGRDEQAPLLAHHYAQAVRPEDADLAWLGEESEIARLRAKAIVWSGRAADLAIGRYEIEDALSLLHRAIDLGPSQDEQVQLWRRVGRANALKFDGAAFWEAMQRAIELAGDVETRADLYGELAFETANRWGMWMRAPDRAMVDGWIERALESAEPASAVRARGLIAWALIHPELPDAPGLAEEARQIAERVGDIELLSRALQARAEVAFWGGDYDQAARWADRRLALKDQISDPDHVASIWLENVVPTLVLGRIDQARSLAYAHEEIAARLSPHHRVHGVSMILFVEELAGRWAAVQELTEETEHRVAANLATPCVFNPRSLLICALAALHLGEEAEAQRLEGETDKVWMEGYGFILDYLRLRLALARGVMETVERLLQGPLALERFKSAAAGTSARLDGLAALGDRARLEDEAPPLIGRRTYLEPFALRALGLVRQDTELIERAVGRFEAMGMQWHADQTRGWLS